MKSSGVTLEEIRRLFKVLEESKSNNGVQVLIDNEMCKQFQDIIETICSSKDKKDKEIERLKAREEEITQKYLSATKYASEIEGKYVVDEYIINELEMYLKRKVEETIGNKAKYYDRVLRELYKLKEDKNE